MLGQIRKLLVNGKDCSIIVPEQRFRYVADCERMRLYRNRSVLSVLLIEIIEKKEGDVSSLEKVLEFHLEPIDTVGKLADGRIGVLLPGISRDEAQAVAEKIESECLAHRCELRIDVLCVPEDDFNIETGLPCGTDKDAQTNSTPVNAGAFLFAVSNPIWKRAIDIGVAATALFLSAPVMAVCGLMTKLSSPGSILFTQERIGHGGKPFRIVKLRTMTVGAEKQVDSLRHLSEQDGPAFKLSTDPRITPVGKILRRFSLDEIPQLWNVLRGDMSLVGPRPLPTAESNKLEFWQRERLDVMPGITGLWQVSGRNELLFDEWMQLDIKYARNQSLLADLNILLRTIPAVLTCRGAS